MAAAIIGTGSYIPDNLITNADLQARGVDTTDEWIVKRTGIKQRFWASESQSTSDLAAAAARAALQRAGVDPADLALTICATSSPDFPLPATASIIQDRIGAKGGAYDLNGVCSGFVSAVATGFAVCQQMKAGAVLVVGADMYSRWLNPRDRGTAVFFGDGAGAVVIAPRSGPSSLLSIVLGSDGALYEKIIIPMGGARRPATAAGLADGQMSIKMDGRAVWDYMTRCVPHVVRQVVDRAGLAMSDVDWLIPHQANRLMLSSIATALELPIARMLIDVDEIGNTAAASVPIALDRAVSRGQIQPGQTVVLVGFGGGMSWSAVCLRWC